MTTEDSFLGGRLVVQQPKNGFRAGTDTVFLAAAIDAAPGQSFLELGCGVGTASLCLAERVPGLHITAVELQADYAALARSNAARNGHEISVVTSDIRDLPPEITARSYDQVFANPPFDDPAHHQAPADPGRRMAHVDQGVLDWIEAAMRRLRPGGVLTLINRAERLQDMLVALDGCDCGDTEILPIAARAGRAAGRVLIRSKKLARGNLTLHSPFIMHDGKSHSDDVDDLSIKARQILRDGGALRWSQDAGK